MTKLARRVTYRGSTRPEIRLLLLTVLCTRWGRGVLTDAESIISFAYTQKEIPTL